MQFERVLDPFCQDSHNVPHHQDRGDTRSNTSRASRPVNDNGSGYELSQLELYDDERPSASLVDHLLPHEGNSKGVEQDNARPGKHDGSKTSVTPVAGSYRSPVRCRKVYALSTLGQAALNLCIAGTCIYFIAFAIMAISHRGDSEASSIVQNLLTAARFGPTIWPIMFSAIIGRFLTSIAAWRLEHGVNVALVEYLIGSRTVFGTISTPIRLRVLHYVLPILITLWALSPLGGQASLRVVSLVNVYTNTTIPISYLESLSPSWMGKADSAMGKTYGTAVNAVFTGALYAPASIREASQDTYGNLKVPLLQALQSRSQNTDERNWYDIISAQHVEYSSLIGLSTLGIPTFGKTSLSIETSYLYPNCTTEKIENEEYWSSRMKLWCSNGYWGDLAIDFDIDHSINESRPIREATKVTEPRRITFLTAGTGQQRGNPTRATCSLTTTYVEVKFVCNGSVCAPTDMRKSQLPHVNEAGTWFDGLCAPNMSNPDSLYFASGLCQNFINSTESNRRVLGASSALARYLVNPDDTITPWGLRPGKGPDPEVDDAVFSYRLAQLMNTYYLASTSLVSVIGGFVSLPPVVNSLVGYSNGSGYGVNTTAQLQTTETVLAYNAAWLIVLIMGSLVMLVAGLATTTLDLLRRAPEVLDSFTGMLRDNPYVHVDIGPSTEDASSQVRSLQKARVTLGDVMPKEATGHVALGTQTEGQDVQRLRSDRLYW